MTEFSTGSQEPINSMPEECVIPQPIDELDSAEKEIIDVKDYLNCCKILFEQRYNNEGSAAVETPFEDFTLHSIVGKGAFGTVVIVNHKSDDSKFFAMKIVKKQQLLRKNLIRYLLNEKRILSCARHPFVIHMDFYAKDSCNVYFVMQLATSGDLFDLLRKKGPLDEQTAKFYSGQLVLALEYLHTVNIIFRDLKPENVLVINDGYIKLADFGMSKRSSERLTTMCGTPQYLAPEIILSKTYGKPVDWWALGVVIFEIVTGSVPFKHDNFNIMFKRILSVQYKTPSTVSPDLSDLIRNLLKFDSTKRFGNLKNGINDIKYHRWFKTIDWMMMLNKKLEVPSIPGHKSTSNIQQVFKESDLECDSGYKIINDNHFADF